MCVGPDSQLFWIGLFMLLGWSALCVLTARRLVRQFAAARRKEDWAQALVDHFPALTVNGLWLFIVFVMARACVL